MLIEQDQTQQLINTKTGEKELATFMLVDAADATSTRSTLPRRQGPESHHYHLNTVKVVFEKEKVLLPESIFNPDYLQRTLQQHSLLDRPLHHDLKLVPEKSSV